MTTTDDTVTADDRRFPVAPAAALALPFGYADGDASRPDAGRTALAERCAPGRGRPAGELVRPAREEFADFDDVIMPLCG
ncbi:hypothetical protein [Streptomyces collinus]|uniref:Uncharacterized protein n=1 Tax=Streptomyces collinus (strain DSM 40733 / Tue 365) TaxID=1214242 RepID=S5UQ32_STRC3|nr:hypothetical protein [Streptomyces collinus]AGS67911.1 hypothetical protein B446_05425 [Streptomyces collinus Tu 365]UJA06542.1 hypothetical protein HGI10_04240 [Streptomyces collinus]UJA12287.1 hypothetical protein HGI10_62690 [Streptomyces collinus]UJA12848.1 hypothetical protein HGI09_01420 [Streptomyces collinus]UJA18590.1 hypothetical protein HGI09_59840 [Streptomyces collinus]